MAPFPHVLLGSAASSIAILFARPSIRPSACPAGSGGGSFFLFILFCQEGKAQKASTPGREPGEMQMGCLGHAQAIRASLPGPGVSRGFHHWSLGSSCRGHGCGEVGGFSALSFALHNAENQLVLSAWERSGGSSFGEV